MSQTDPRPPAADGERDLPEEIVKAIETALGQASAVIHEAHEGSPESMARARRLADQSRSALTTSILSRLTAAEAGREEAEARAEKLAKALGLATDELEEIVSFTREERCCLREQEIASIAMVAAASRSALTEAQPKGDQ